MTQTDTAEAHNLRSINGYRELHPDASQEQLVKIQSDAMRAYRNEVLGIVATGVSFSVGEEVAKSIGRNDG